MATRKTAETIIKSVSALAELKEKKHPDLAKIAKGSSTFPAPADGASRELIFQILRAQT